MSSHAQHVCFLWVCFVAPLVQSYAPNSLQKTMICGWWFSSVSHLPVKLDAFWPCQVTKSTRSQLNSQKSGLYSQQLQCHQETSVLSEISGVVQEWITSKNVLKALLFECQWVILHLECLNHVTKAAGLQKMLNILGTAPKVSKYIYAVDLR